MIRKQTTLRTRCKRWLGSIQRQDRYTWTLLMSANFCWWPDLVGKRVGIKENWKDYVELANEDELEKLWHEIEEYRIRKLYENK